MYLLLYDGQQFFYWTHIRTVGRPVHHCKILLLEVLPTSLRFMAQRVVLLKRTGPISIPFCHFGEQKCLQGSDVVAGLHRPFYNKKLDHTMPAHSAPNHDSLQEWPMLDCVIESQASSPLPPNEMWTRYSDIERCLIREKNLKLAAA